MPLSISWFKTRATSALLDEKKYVQRVKMKFSIIIFLEAAADPETLPNGPNGRYEDSVIQMAVIFTVWGLCDSAMTAASSVGSYRSKSDVELQVFLFGDGKQFLKKIEIQKRNKN